MSRMTIHGIAPQAERVNDGLPPMLPLPDADGRIYIEFVRKRVPANAFLEATVIAFARRYGATCAAAVDMELAVVKAERDALQGRLNELQQS